MIENNLSHKSGAKSTLYKVAMNVFLLSLHICIRSDGAVIHPTDLCDRLFSIIKLMNAGHTFI